MVAVSQCRSIAVSQYRSIVVGVLILFLLWRCAVELEYKFPKWIQQIRDTPAKIILLHSGRGGGGKTTALALFAVTEAIEKPGSRIVLGREIMRSSRESNIAMVEEWLQHPGPNLKPSAYKATARAITFSNGSEILFMGLSSSHGTSAAFQSTTDISMLIVDEAQALTQETCRRVFPTIRRPNSKIVLSYNPISPTNAVEAYRRQAQDPKKNRVVFPDGRVIDPFILDIPLTWRDNKWFKQSDLYAQLLWDKENAPGEYAHKWEGEYQDDGGYRIANYTDILRCYREWDEVTLQRAMAGEPLSYGLDLAASKTGDSTALVCVQGGVVRDTRLFEKGQKFTDTARYLVTLELPEWCHFDATGIGGSFQDVVHGVSSKLGDIVHPIMFGASPGGKKTLWDGEINNGDFFYSRRDQMYFALKNRIENTLAFLDETREVSPTECLLLSPKHLSLRQVETLGGQIAQPVYQFGSRGQVRFDKTPEGENSPDLLDALALAYAPDSAFGLQNSRLRDVQGIEWSTADPVASLFEGLAL